MSNMSNTTRRTCRNFPFFFNGHLWDYISVIPTLVTLLNSSLLSACANFAVGYVFYSTRQLWQRKHIFTINLTLLNLLTALLAIPTYFTFLLTFIKGNAWCSLGDVSLVIHRFCFSMTAVTVSLISYQRFFSVLYPYRYQALVTLEWHIFTVVASWFYGLTIAIPWAAEIKTSWPSLKSLGFASKLIILAHITSTIFCYGRMGYIASCHRKRISNTSKHLEKLCKTKKTSLHLIGTLLVSTLPWLALEFVPEHPIQVEYVTYGIFFATSFLNLFIYTLRNEDIEAAFQRKVKGRIRQELNMTRARSTVHPQVLEILSSTHNKQLHGL